MKTKINQIITALFELEARECHRTYFEYGNGLFRVRIIQIKTDRTVYERTVNVVEEPKALKEMLDCIIDMRYLVTRTTFQCYRREFVKGVKSDKWEKTEPVIEHGKNATAAMNIDRSGYFIDDIENGVQYFVDLKDEIETGK
jgi:hypothetical protein